MFVDMNIERDEIWWWALCCVGYAIMLSEVSRLRGLRWLESAGAI